MHPRYAAVLLCTLLCSLSVTVMCFSSLQLALTGPPGAMGFTGRPGPLVWKPSYICVFLGTLHVYMCDVSRSNSWCRICRNFELLCSRVFFRVPLGARVWRERAEILVLRFIVVLFFFLELWVCVCSLITLDNLFLRVPEVLRVYLVLLVNLEDA